MTYTHRIMHELYCGPIPPGYVVMHSCDNPVCCNPSHLSMGTQADNMADRDRKGRTRIKQQRNQGNCKLTELQVIGVMARLLTGRERQKHIAADMGVSSSVICDIWKGNAWAHLWTYTHETLSEKDSK